MDLEKPPLDFKLAFFEEMKPEERSVALIMPLTHGSAFAHILSLVGDDSRAK